MNEERHQPETPGKDASGDDAYEEPVDYLPEKAAKYLGEKRPEPGQEGISGLLEGNQLFIKPEGFDELHDRGGIQHRLKDEKKWLPLGIGAGKAEEESAEATRQEES